VVHRHDAVQRGLQRRAVALLADVVGVLEAAALDELAELRADDLERRLQVGIGFSWARSEDLDDADDAALAADREADRRVQARRLRRRPPRQPVVGRGVGDPGRLPGLPDASGQTVATGQRGRARSVRERPCAVVVGRPDGDAVQRLRIAGRRLPSGRERPAEPAGDRLQRP
jgi:hypothetical protein